MTWISGTYVYVAVALFVHLAESFDVFMNNPYARRFADETNFAPGFIADVKGEDRVVKTHDGMLRGRRRDGIPEAGRIYSSTYHDYDRIRLVI